MKVNRLLNFTTFDQQNAGPGQVHCDKASWETIVEVLSTHQIVREDTDKGEEVHFNGHRYGPITDEADNRCGIVARRNNTHIDCDLLILDIDKNQTIEEFIEQYSEFTYVLYSSFYHDREKDGEAARDKFRAVFPFPRTISKQEWLDYVYDPDCPDFDWELDEFAPHNDEKSLKLTQPFCIPIQHPNEGKAVSHINEGKLLDVTKWRKVDRTVVQKKKRESSTSSITGNEFPVDQQFRMLNNSWLTVEEMTVGDHGVYCPFHKEGLETRSSGSVRKHEDGFASHTCFACGPKPVTRLISRNLNDDTNFVNFIKKKKEEQPLVVKDVPTADELLVYEGDSGDDGLQYNSRWCKPIPVRAGIFFVKSPKGTGKTYQLRILVDKLRKQGKSVLVIGHRVSLLKDMATRLGLTYYKDDDTKIKDMSWGKDKHLLSWLAVCANSLPLIPFKPQTQYDYIILDESEQLLQHMGISKGTIPADKRLEVTRTFFNLVNAASSVVALDADLSDLTIDTLSELKPDVYMDGHINTVKVESGVVKMYENKTNLIMKILEAIQSGDSVYVATNSRNFVEWFGGHLTDIGIKHMAISRTNGSTASALDYMSELTSLTKDDSAGGRVLLASPTIGTGVDIQVPFDHVFGLFEAKVTTHTDMDQQIYRARHPKNVSVWVDVRKFCEPTFWKKIKSDLESDDELTKLLVDFQGDGAPGGKTFEYLVRLHSRVVATRNMSMNSLRGNFGDLKRAQGWETEFIEQYDQPDEIDIKLLKAMEEERRRLLIQAATKVNRHEYKRLDAKRVKTEQEVLSLIRFQIEDFFKEDVEENGLIIGYFFSDYPKRIRARKFMKLSRERLENLDVKDLGKRQLLDRKRNLIRHELLTRSGEILGIMKDGEVVGHDPFSKDSPQVERFIKYAQSEAGLFKRVVGMTVTGIRAEERPMGVVKVVVEKMGLELSTAHVTKAGNAKGTKTTWYENCAGWMSFVDDVIEKQENAVDCD